MCFDCRFVQNMIREPGIGVWAMCILYFWGFFEDWLVRGRWGVVGDGGGVVGDGGGS